MPQKICILGGGFGGVRCALVLARQRLPDTHVCLISERSHVEYTPALYRVATGGAPEEAYLPLADIFRGTGVEFLRDEITGGDLSSRRLDGASGAHYSFSTLVLAVGGEAENYGIPGIQERAYGMRTLTDALRFKRHIHDVLEACRGKEAQEQVPGTHIVIVGGGATGVELAGELAGYAQHVAQHHVVPSTFITIDLLEAMPRLLFGLPDGVAKRVHYRLHALGVNVFLGRTVVKEEVETLFLKDMEIRAKTVVWTAGMRGHRLLRTLGLPLDRKGRVTVNQFLQVEGWSDVYALGDAAATRYGGMAQTACRDGAYVARTIARAIRGGHPQPYIPRPPIAAIPVGPRWAIVVFPWGSIGGRLGWYLRRIADIKVLSTFLPLRKAWNTWRAGAATRESCVRCGGGE